MASIAGSNLGAKAGLRGFTLVELLVVVSIVVVLSALLLPVLAAAKESAKQSACLSNLRQLGVGLQLYLADSDDRLPDRRDLKATLPGGYRPWSSWPPSDPRSGWALVVLEPYIKSREIGSCRSVEGSVLGQKAQVLQETESGAAKSVSRYWMWRFDRVVDPVPLDNLWGKTPEQSISDLQAANNPQAGRPESVAEIEMAVDPYFPRTIPTVDPALKGVSVHFGGRNRLFLDVHVKYFKDIRLKP